MSVPDIAYAARRSIGHLRTRPRTFRPRPRSISGAQCQRTLSETSVVAAFPTHVHKSRCRKAVADKQDKPAGFCRRESEEARSR
eukprot:2144365-Rhodomonas_salina.1